MWARDRKAAPVSFHVQGAIAGADVVDVVVQDFLLTSRKGREAEAGVAQDFAQEAETDDIVQWWSVPAVSAPPGYH